MVISGGFRGFRLVRFLRLRWSFWSKLPSFKRLRTRHFSISGTLFKIKVKLLAFVVTFLKISGLFNNDQNADFLSFLGPICKDQSLFQEHNFEVNALIFQDVGCVFIKIGAPFWPFRSLTTFRFRLHLFIFVVVFYHFRQENFPSIPW